MTPTGIELTNLSWNQQKNKAGWVQNGFMKNNKPHTKMCKNKINGDATPQKLNMQQSNNKQSNVWEMSWNEIIHFQTTSEQFHNTKNRFLHWHSCPRNPDQHPSQVTPHQERRWPHNWWMLDWTIPCSSSYSSSSNSVETVDLRVGLMDDEGEERSSDEVFEVQQMWMWQNESTSKSRQ